MKYLDKILRAHSLVFKPFYLRIPSYTYVPVIGFIYIIIIITIRLTIRASNMGCIPIARVLVFACVPLALSTKTFTNF